jgi:hypothetical protein
MSVLLLNRARSTPLHYAVFIVDLGHRAPARLRRWQPALKLPPALTK